MTTYNLLINILYAFELLSFALAFKLFLDGERSKVFVAFLIILFLTSAVETFGFLQKVLIEKDSRINNLLYYNVYGYMVYTIWYYIFYVILKRCRKMVVILFLGFLCITSYEIVFLLDHTVEAQVFPFIYTGMSLLVFVLLYFTEILKKKASDPLRENLIFWICVGLLFYHVINIPFALLQDQLIVDFYTYGKYFYMAKVLFATVMYLCFSIGLSYSIKRNQAHLL